MKDAAAVEVGTSGYYYRDWVGAFYPAGATGRGMLEHYVGVFPALELNSTYYRIPQPASMARLARGLPEGYRLVLKTHKAATHGQRRLDDVAACKQALASFAARGIEPIFLAQFPQSFRYAPANLEYVRRLVFEHRPYAIAVEFRHNSWLAGRTLKALRDEQAIFVNVDEPALEGLLPATAEATHETFGYVRLHGRNADGWWGASRYDYFYSQGELAEWLPRIEALRAKCRNLLVFFNNCHRASAAQNALDFARLLGVRLAAPAAVARKPSGPARSSQGRLFSEPKASKG